MYDTTRCYETLPPEMDRTAVAAFVARGLLATRSAGEAHMEATRAQARCVENAEKVALLEDVHIAIDRFAN